MVYMEMGAETGILAMSNIPPPCKELCTQKPGMVLAYEKPGMVLAYEKLAWFLPVKINENKCEKGLYIIQNTVECILWKGIVPTRNG